MSNLISSLVSKLVAGDRIALARAITLIESTLESDQKKAAQVLQLLPANSTALRIAISGSPGVGKSTFIDSLGQIYLAQNKKVAVLAIDPSSQATGGSILGDKTRMEELGRSARAFIRPSPAGGTLGGLAEASYEVSLLCEAAGYDLILFETVGVGQSEILAYHLSDIFVLLLQPAAGDELQGMKKGIIEIADLLVVNKCDGDLLERAEATKIAFAQVWKQENEDVILCSSTNKGGLNLVTDALERISVNINFALKRKEREVFWFKESCKRQILKRVLEKNSQLFLDLSQAIRSDDMHYTKAVEKVVSKVLS